jgi:hypothetical protein
MEVCIQGSLSCLSESQIEKVNLQMKIMFDANQCLRCFISVMLSSERIVAVNWLKDPGKSNYPDSRRGGEFFIIQEN